MLSGATDARLGTTLRLAAAFVGAAALVLLGVMLGRHAVLAVEAQPAVAAELTRTVAPRFPGRFFVIAAALAGEAAAGFTSLRVYNELGMSSSLAPARDAAKWAALDAAAGRPVTPFVHTPVLSLRALLDALPPDVDVPVLQTDAQGYDFVIVRGAGGSLRRARRVRAEVFRGNPEGVLYHLPAGVSNDFDHDWVPYMAAAGYRLVEAPRDKAWGDATWERVGAV
ncbi:hypothetical protein I4F81_005716 [Pyropia yezoensis]|uniref:Uncharacterized protein n=1 Tax=Pyropia yezoensis TaxID=2788 RepID=A0ACC3BZJ8_PYRYE|nr:hypothetical protein I4F81_005716 [Neopyropia yezoensis]